MLAWPGTAVGYRLETTTNLLTDADWQDASEAVDLVDGEFIVTPMASDTVRFFRLFRTDNPGNNPPSLTEAALDASVVAPDGTVNLRFRFSDPDADLQTLVVTRSNWNGETTDRIPVSQLGVGGAAGEFNQPLNTRSLAFGINSVCVWLEDAGGRPSPTSCFELTLSAGMGGTAPQLAGLTPARVEQRLPVKPDKVLRQFALVWNDPDGDVERVRGRITRPGQPPQLFELPVRSLGFTGNGGTTTLPLLGITGADEPGENLIEVALVDANGNVGNFQSATVVTARDAGEELLRVEGALVLHDGDPQNRRVLVNGRGFDPAGPELNSVQLDGVELAVLAVTATSLHAALPADAQPGFIRVANRNGSAWAREPLAGLPVELRLLPDNAAVPSGGTQIFTALLNQRPTPQVAWAVNGIPGGNAEVGVITASGEYVSPVTASSARTVVVSAAWLNDPAVTTSREATLLPPPPLVDAGLVAAGLGGTVVTRDGRASVELPPDALSADATVSLKLLEGPERPAAPVGQRVLAAFQLEAQPAAGSPGTDDRPARQGLGSLILRAPVVVTVPLVVGQPPGTAPIPGLEVRAGGSLLPDVPTVVSGDGSSVSIQLPVFGEIIIFIPVVQPVGPPPVLTDFIAFGPNPTVLEEGRSVPVRLVGQNLTEDLQAEIRKVVVDEQAGGEIQWNGTLDVVPGTLQVLSGSSTAGITLHVRTIRDLHGGESQDYILMLRRPDQTFTSIPFQVAGLNELELAPGERRNWNSQGPLRYSEINIPGGATVTIEKPQLIVDSVAGTRTLRGGVLEWESTGPVRMDGVIDGFGGHGGDGRRSNGGSRGNSLAGDGGVGRIGDDICDGVFLNTLDERGYGISDPSDYDQECLLFLRFSLGKAATDWTTESRAGLIQYQRYGFGGFPGKNGSLLEDIGAVLSVVVSVVNTALETIGCATTGTTCAFLVSDIAQAVGNVSALVELFNDDEGRGTPGRPGEPSRLSGHARGHGGGGGGGGGGYDYVFDDEPGGGGGAGGGGGKGIIVTSSASVSLGGTLTSRGGNGGNASEDSDFLPGTDDDLPSPSRFSGGAGGAGSGGDIIIRTLGRVQRGFRSVIDAEGGRPGYGGILLPREGGGTLLLADPQSQPAQPGRQEFRGTPQSASQELVLTRRLYPLNGNGLAEPATQVIRSETGAMRRVTVAPGQNVTAILFDGFNRIYDVRDEGGSDLLQRCVLVLPDGVGAGPDQDGDGLGENDERELGTDPLNPDTDNDGVNDRVEVTYCRNPRVAEPPGFQTDRDCDGWPDALEEAAGTSPDNPAASPRFTWVANPSTVETARPEIPVPTRFNPFVVRPPVVSGPETVELARPAFNEPPAAVPNTTVALPPVLEAGEDKP